MLWVRRTTTAVPARGRRILHEIRPEIDGLAEELDPKGAQYEMEYTKSETTPSWQYFSSV